INIVISHMVNTLLYIPHLFCHFYTPPRSGFSGGCIPLNALLFSFIFGPFSPLHPPNTQRPTGNQINLSQK
ncbi:hypothetical protein, partial [Escherichia coli]|uniref:hypothetical protein n=1 Tax=Escherichia coli TaxID=562 RepID=UPI001485B3B6